MFFETKLSRYLAEIICHLKRKRLTVQSSLPFVLFSLFTGFLSGNLFGTFLEKFRSYLWWDGFVGLFVLLFIEIINALVYGLSKREYSDLSFFKKKKVLSHASKMHPEQDFAPPKLYRFTNIPVFGFANRRLVETSSKSHLLYTITYIKRTINSFKIGLLFGFFVDSFKVGS